jgi:hypothetical protein
VVNPLREPTKRLIQRSRVARHIFVLLVWPFAHVADRLRGIDPPSSLRRGLQWARGEHEPAIPHVRAPRRGAPPEQEGLNTRAYL